MPYVDLNADHLDSWVLDPAGNPLGAPHTIPLALEGLMNVHTSVPTTGKAASDQPMLVAEHVDLYYGAAQALWDVSLTARAGEVTALMGRNGVGKTSFLRAVVGEQPIARGTIALNGVSLGRMAPHDRARLAPATLAAEPRFAEPVRCFRQ